MPHKPFTPSGSWSESRLLEGQRQCAEMTIRYCVVMMSRGVEKVLIHSGSSGSVNMPAMEWCIPRYGGAPAKMFPVRDGGAARARVLERFRRGGGDGA